MCDASNCAFEVVFEQCIDRLPHVVYYANRTLNDAQLNFTEKEFLAVVFALDKFRFYLLGFKVIIFSNHAALKYLLLRRMLKHV